MGISSNNTKYRSSSSGSTSSISTLVVNNSNTNEIWIDGPNSNNSSKPNTLKSPNSLKLTTPESIQFINEIWIDGPNAELSKTESKTSTKPKYKKSNSVKFKNEIETTPEQITSYFDSIKEKYNTHHKDLSAFGSNTPKPKELDKSDSFESLECLDRQLLRQLNEHDLDAIDTVFKTMNPIDSNSRPISLLSVNSNDIGSSSTNTSTSMTTITNNLNSNASSDNILLPSIRSSFQEISDEINSLDSSSESSLNPVLSYKQKLEDMKTSYDQMVFKQSYKQMESLHKTLESFLNLDQSSKLTMMMKPVKSTIIAPADDLKMNATLSSSSTSSQLMSHSEKEKRLSRILSPTRFKPAPQIHQIFSPINVENTTQPSLYQCSSTFSTKTNDTKSISPSGSSLGSTSSSSSPCSTSSISSSSSSSFNLKPNSSASSSSNYSEPLSNPACANKILYKTNPINSRVLSSNDNQYQYAEPFDNLIDYGNLNKLSDLTQVSSSSSTASTSSTSSSSSSGSNFKTNVYLINKNAKSVQQNSSSGSVSANNRLFFNFNHSANNRNYYESTVNASLPTSPAHQPSNPYLQPMIKNRIVLNANNSSYHEDSSQFSNSVSVPSTPVINKRVKNLKANNKNQQNQAPVFKILKQTSNLFSANNVACGADRYDRYHTLANPKTNKESILNRIFSRSKSKTNSTSNSMDESNTSSFKTSLTCVNPAGRRTGSFRHDENDLNDYYYNKKENIGNSPLTSSGYDSSKTDSNNDDSDIFLNKLNSANSLSRSRLNKPGKICLS